MHMARTAGWLVLLGLVLGFLGCSVRPEVKHIAPSASERAVLVISVDGLRPDLLLLADCPNMRKLIKGGSYSFWAQTTPVGITLPSHTSMVTGVKVETHGITWNNTHRPVGTTYEYPQAQTLFELAKARGYTTALVSGKLKFKTLAKPGTVDWLELPDDEKGGDLATTDAAVRVVREHQPDVMLFHLAETDIVGHAEGWGTPEQIAVIEQADACVGRVVDALHAVGGREHTLIILTADHGGFGKKHNGRDPRGLHIPWIASGAGVRPNYDLNRDPDLVIHTEDTFATACAFMSIPLPKDIDGRPVIEAFAPSR